MDELHSALEQLERESGTDAETPTADLLRHAARACQTLESGVRTFGAQIDALRGQLAAEEELRKNADERFKLAYENSPFSMAIATLSEGRFRDVNPVFLNNLGYTREEVIGKTSAELGIFPETGGRSFLVDALRKDGRADALELSARKKDGSLRRGRIYARVVTYNGEACILSLTQNVDEIHRAEQEAMRLRQFYEQLLQDLPAQIAIFDTQCRYLYISPSTVKNAQTREWLLNRTDFDYCELRGIDRSLAARRAAWINAAIAKGEIVSQEERFVSSDGEIRYYIRTFTPIFDYTGHVKHVIAYGHDITEYKHLEDQLRHAQKMEAIGRLAGGVAHDFNNLLTAMMGIAEYILPQAEESPTLAAGIAEIQSTARRAAELTRQLLAFSRRQPSKHVPVDIAQTIGAIGSMLRRIIGETVSLRMSFPQELPRFMGDPGQLEQIIMNLAVNARDAMPHGGELSILISVVSHDDDRPLEHALLRPGDHVRIVVRDTGVGMDDDTKRRVFEPFFTTKGEGKGTGLGLSTVYAIVERWGGRVYVESIEGAGTGFYIYLPAVEAPAERIEAARIVATQTQGSETVLVVEDETTVREVVSRILRHCGYTVLEAASGEEAFTLAKHYTGPIDMLVSDMVMPGMSGRELAELLETHRPGLRMLFMSGHCEDEDAEFVSELESPRFIQKPFTATELASKVRELLDVVEPQRSDI